MAAVKEKKSPGVMAPAITWWPPYQSAPMMPKAASTSMSGSVTSSVRWSLSARSSSRPFTRAKRSASCPSRPKALTIFVPENASCSSTFSSATFSCERLLMRYSRRPIERTVTPTKGKMTSAIRASRHSRTSMTDSSAMTIAICRKAITSTVEDTRASRLTSVTMRDISSAECRPAKNDSGMLWMCV